VYLTYPDEQLIGGD